MSRALLIKLDTFSVFILHVHLWCISLLSICASHCYSKQLCNALFFPASSQPHYARQRTVCPLQYSHCIIIHRTPSDFHSYSVFLSISLVLYSLTLDRTYVLHSNPIAIPHRSKCEILVNGSGACIILYVPFQFPPLLSVHNSHSLTQSVVNINFEWQDNCIFYKA